MRLTEKGTRQSRKGTINTPALWLTYLDDQPAKIKQAVQELFKVKVLAINTMNVHGKLRRKRTTQAGRASDWKKAIVTLKEGDKSVLT